MVRIKFSKRSRTMKNGDLIKLNDKSIAVPDFVIVADYGDRWDLIDTSNFSFYRSILKSKEEINEFFDTYYLAQVFSTKHSKLLIEQGDTEKWLKETRLLLILH